MDDTTSLKGTIPKGGSGKALMLLVLLCFWLLPSSALFNVPLAVLCLIGIAVLARVPELRRDAGWRLYLVVWLCLWLPQVASLPDAVNLERSFYTTLGFLKFPLAGAAILWAVRRHTGLEAGVMLGVTVVFGLYAADMLWQLHAGKDVFGFPVFGGPRATGPSVDDKLAIAMGVFVPLALESSIRFRRLRWLVMPLTVVLVVGILFSGQRGGALAMLIGGGLWSVLFFSSRAGVHARRLALGLVIVAVALSAVAFGNLQDLPGRYQQTALLFKGDKSSVNSAFAGRVGQWVASVELFTRHPVNGIGPRGYRYVLAEKGEIYERTAFAGRKPYVATHPHQQFLEIGVETGMIGIAGYLAMLGLLVWLLWQRRRESGMAWAVCAFAAIFPLNMSMAFYGTYWSHVVLLALVMAVSLGSHRPSDRGIGSGLR